VQQLTHNAYGVQYYRSGQITAGMVAAQVQFVLQLL